jgi:hypothetical protein
VVINNLHIVGAIASPTKNDAPLGIDANAVKTLQITA